VHSSCSDNKLLAINHALSDLYTLSHVALTELLDPATTSASLLDGPEQHPLLTSLYFGDAKRPNSMATAVGFFTMILLRDKQGLLLRCDDPDGKCKEHSDWAGHWRGDENPGETVICDRSFTGQQETTTDNASTGPPRKFLDDVCLNGWTLSESRPEVFWSTDLIHRFLHLPYISGGQSLHAAKAYPNALHLGRLEPELAAMNVANLQYFALDVYA
ncbi:zincin, partial [Acaromyces ingoldii]